MITPSKKIFLEVIKNGKIPPLYEEIPYSSPCLLYEFLTSPNSFLLESVKGPEKIARYSFIGFNPCLIFKIKNGYIEIETSDKNHISGYAQNNIKIPPSPPLLKGGRGGYPSLIPPLLRGDKGGVFSTQKNITSSKPLNVLKNLVKSYEQSSFEFLSPFQGGLVGIFSYDFVQYLERLPKNAVDDLNLPDAHFLMIDKLIVFDHVDKKCWIIVCPGVKDSVEEQMSNKLLNWSEKYDEAVEKIHDTRYRIQDVKFKTKELRISNHASCIRHHASSINYEMEKNEYMDIVKRAKEYIAAGDIFQANLSQRVSAHITDKSPWSLYKILRFINPSPFAAFIDLGAYQIVSSSPERLLRVKNGIIETRPIAGTRPRGKDKKEDELMRTELLLNEKERAEHIMLIDLERNDLGRVSEYGTVRVDELMITEDYSHVIHIVSNVMGNLSDGRDCFDAIKAAFPGGTITGVPKVRCMEIIDELEPVRRGPYTGSIGYISFSGNMDLNIVIRTFVIVNDIAYVQVGAGIVADSEPEREYFETLKKAEALIKTLEMV